MHRRLPLPALLPAALAALILALGACTIEAPDNSTNGSTPGGDGNGDNPGGDDPGGDSPGGDLPGGDTQCSEDADCDDGDACTVGEHCDDGGTCVDGVLADCDDGVGCTEDVCIEDPDADDGWACSHPTVGGSCLIDDTCYGLGDSLDDPCSACVPALSQDTWSPATDGTSCPDGVCVGGTCEAIPAGLPDDLVYIPAGPFPMGCAGSGCQDPDEQPQHVVELSAYAIQRYEVTADEYADCVDAGPCEAPDLSGNKPEPTYGEAAKGDHPINWVSWEMADTYCKWAGRRLCTEAEWEKAARGTDGRTYPWGEDAPSCDLAIRYVGAPEYVFGCGEKETWPVGSVPAGASPWGVEDMAGNVWEFVADWYGNDYYESSPAIDPKGPFQGKDRVVRGGGWESNEFDLRTYNRFTGDEPHQTYGIRCCASPP